MNFVKFPSGLIINMANVVLIKVDYRPKPEGPDVKGYRIEYLGGGSRWFEGRDFDALESWLNKNTYAA